MTGDIYMGFDSSENKRKIVLIVQCRLSSTRLPGKALLPLKDRTALEWNLRAMSKVVADDYYLATDEASLPELKGIAEKCGFKIFGGSRDDVLDRFCRVIEISGADLVVRATADNPFLFYEAANDLISRWIEKSASEKIDYMTFSGLPHGCGVEMFDAHSLLDAARKTDLPYDHEHVGPSLYNHPENFVSVFEEAPQKYNHPELRTTIDTSTDYIRAQKIVDYCSSLGYESPYTTEQVLGAFEKSAIKNPVLLVPSVEKGHGTGHLHRCLNLAAEKGWDIYIPEDASLDQCGALVSSAFERGLKPYQVVKTLDWLELYSLVVTDMFVTPGPLMEQLSSKCPVCALDEGAVDPSYAGYLLDIIPSVGLERKANLVEPGFIPLPENRKTVSGSSEKIDTALVVLGGEDPTSLSVPAANALAGNSIQVTLVAPSEKARELLEEKIDRETKSLVTVVPPIENLKEKLSGYDLVVTHYGFTAFEAAAAGCAIVLLGTTRLHQDLALKYGFPCLPPEKLNRSEIGKLVSSPSSLHRPVENHEGKSLGDYLEMLSKGLPLACPVCRKGYSTADTLVARTPQRTFRRCGECGMLYQSWTVQSVQTEYNREYFYEDYEKQYGKTYEDDFESIKSQGRRRIGMIGKVFNGHANPTGTVLDIGCALGPFMDAANDAGWKVYGTDISQDAVNYVKDKLNLPAICSAFPKVNLAKEFGLDGFDAVTMWFVIEHFQNLDEVLKNVSSLVKKGGVFAFSTPSASGVSGRYNTQGFYEQSPSDHYSLWEPSKADSILRKYGFKVCRIVPTGIHPERFPSAKKNGWTSRDIQFKFLEKISRFKILGDTFEVYCRKVK